MRCNGCPVAAQLACLGEIHPPLCDDVRRGHPGRAEQLAALADPGAAPDAGEAIKADLCPHGAGACGCGPLPRLCGHPDRPAEVWRPACLRCVAVGEWEARIGTIA